MINFPPEILPSLKEQISCSGGAVTLVLGVQTFYLMPLEIDEILLYYMKKVYHETCDCYNRKKYNHRTQVRWHSLYFPGTTPRHHDKNKDASSAFRGKRIFIALFGKFEQEVAGVKSAFMQRAQNDSLANLWFCAIIGCARVYRIGAEKNAKDRGAGSGGCKKQVPF